MAVTARRRSFHLNPCDQSQSSFHSQTLGSTVTPRSAGVVAASLLAFAQQASIFVFTLLGGCVPAMHRRVPRALVAGASSSANIPSEARAATEVATREQAMDGVSAEANTISISDDEEVQKQPEDDAALAGVRRRKPVAVGVVDVERAGSTATARSQNKLPLADDASGSGLNCGEAAIPLPDATESDDVKFEPVEQEQAAADPILLPLVAQPADSSETANATVLQPTESETTTIIAPVPRQAHGQSAVAAAAFGFKARVGVGLGVLVPSTSTGTIQLLSPQSRCASPTPEVAADADTSAPASKPQSHDHASPHHPELRADLVQRVKAFTAARLAGTHVPVPSPRRAAPTPTPRARPPLDRTGLDDPFVTPTQPRQRQHQSHSPPVPNLAFALARIRALRPAQQSPTPHQHARKGRPVLRQQTVFFKQAQTPTGTSAGTHTPAPPKPKFWAPHPAGSRSCAIAIKAPARWPPVEDKENCVVLA